MSNTPYATFAADVIAAGMSRDRRAAARVKEFVTSAEFAVTKANAALPTIGRGDAYGDGPISATPVLDFSMAPLDNGNPQSVPHWSSEETSRAPTLRAPRRLTVPSWSRARL